jgi:hypothetical protein
MNITGQRSLQRPNNADARLHVETLFGDPRAIIHARTIPERASVVTRVFALETGQRPRMRFSGRLDELEERLRLRNAAGFAIYLTVNLTDGQGVKRENIVHVRNLVLDLDGSPLPKEWEIQPHVVVETSPSRFQATWSIEPTKDLEQAEETSRRIAKHYDGDPKVIDASHVFRLAGFYHQKGRTPFLSRIVHVGFAPPTPLRAFDCFLPRLPKRRAAKPRHDESSLTLEQAQLLFEYLPVDEIRGNEDWLTFAMALHHASDGDDEIAEAFFEFCMTDPAYADDEHDAKNRARWESFDSDRTGGVTKGTLVKMCADAGMPAAIRARIFFDRIAAKDDFNDA